MDDAKNKSKSVESSKNMAGNQPPGAGGGSVGGGEEEEGLPKFVRVHVDRWPSGDTPYAQVQLERSSMERTSSQAFWTRIRASCGTGALSFDRYSTFIEHVLCGEKEPRDSRAKMSELWSRRALPFPDIDTYRLLKVATEVFMMCHCGIVMKTAIDELAEYIDETEESRRYNSSVTLDEIKELWAAYLGNILIAPESPQDASWESSGTIPYLALIARKLGGITLASPGTDQSHRADLCYKVIKRKLTQPCLLELIWSYWHEEGMLVQTMNSISMRFQNRRVPGRDPLANVAIDPLRPLNNLLWGTIQDEQHRLTLARRTYEYDHHYGMRPYGKAVPSVRAADSRSKFLDVFHNLLHLCTVFFQQDDDTMVKADPFPVLNALKQVHLVLTEGQHNQYGDLPWTARQEMLMQQWLLARPEMREFLPRRVMVAYPEPWMDSVDAMKKLQGWTDTSVLHFRDLGVFGEMLLLGVRYGNWNSVVQPDEAGNWARYWRAEIQGYIHAYRVATGADLTMQPVDVTLPCTHLKKRLTEQLARM